MSDTAQQPRIRLLMDEDEIARLRASGVDVRAVDARTHDVLEMDYHGQYLKSRLWRRIKKRVLERDNHRCRSCGGPGIYVHHRSYERDVLEGRHDEMLATVCDGCHNIIHFRDDGTARPQDEWDAQLLPGQRQTDIPEPRVDLRQRIPERPVNWHRLTAVQKDLWLKRWAQLRKERVALKPKKPRPVGGFFAPHMWGGKSPFATCDEE